MKKIIALLLMTVFVLSACSASNEEGVQKEGAKEEGVQSVETGIDSINKYGSITLTIGPESMKQLGYEPADIILVRIGDAEMEMPIGTNYADADSGEPICCFKRSDSKGKDVVVLAINYGNLAETLGIAEMHEIDTDPGFEWEFVNGLNESVPVYISMSDGSRCR